MTQSAVRHGWSRADILWAVEHSLVTVSVTTRQPEGVMGLLHLGPARDGRILEVVTILDDHGEELAIHAMTMRAAYRPLLEGGVG